MFMSVMCDDDKEYFARDLDCNLCLTTRHKFGRDFARFDASHTEFEIYFQLAHTQVKLLYTFRISNEKKMDQISAARLKSEYNLFSFQKGFYGCRLQLFIYTSSSPNIWLHAQKCCYSRKKGSVLNR